MAGEYLPPVIAEFRADIADFIRKVEEVKLALDSVGSTSSRSFARMEGDSRAATRELDGVRRTADDAERSLGRMGETSRRTATRARTDWDAWFSKMETLFPDIRNKWDSAFGEFQTKHEEAAKRMEGDFRDAFKNIAERDARDAFKTIIADAEKAGDDAGGGFWSKFTKKAAAFGPQKGWQQAVAVGLPLIPSAAAGLAAPIVSGAVSALPGVAGSAGMLLFLKDAFGEVTQAATTLETQTNKYNTAADNTAQFLASDSQAMTNFHALLGQVTPQQADALQLITKQDVAWQDLSLSQQQGVIQVRETNDLYKALTQSQKDSINALLSEKAAWDKLEPAQQQALTQYQNMHDAYDNLRTLSMPSIFSAIASAEHAAADAMKPLAPVIQQAALGWKDLFDSADRWFQSSDYKKFVQLWASDTRASIDAFGRGIGNVVLGFIHMWEALQPMIGPSLDWIDKFSAKFANWATTPKGMTELQHFMQDLAVNGPPVWKTLGNISKGLGDIISALGNDPLPWLILQHASQILAWFGSTEAGKAVINVLAWGLAVAKLAGAITGMVAALKALAPVAWLLGKAGIGGAAASASGGAAAAAGGTAATRAAPAVMPILGPSSAVAGGEAATFMGISSESAIMKWLRDTMEIHAVQGLTAGGAAFGVALAGVALAAFHEAQLKVEAQREGIIRNMDGSFSAATSVSGVHVSQAFRDMANTVANAAQSSGVTVQKGGTYAAGRFGQYTEDWRTHNQAMVDTMVLGRTQFGQTAALFVQQWHGNVQAMGQAVQKSGSTLDQDIQSSLTSIFSKWGQTMPGYWSGLQSSYNKASLDAFNKMEGQSKTDYTGLQQAMNTYEDDLKNGRQLNAKDDATKLQKAMDQFMADAVSGNIDTANKQIGKLATDMNQYLKDWTSGNTAAAQKDIEQMGRDLSGTYQATTADTATQVQKLMAAQMKLANADLDAIKSGQAGPPRTAQYYLDNPFARAQGGPVYGPGTGTSDSIPTMLSHGEYVINARSTSRHYQLLEAINSNKMATGGIVGAMGAHGGASDYGYIKSAFDNLHAIAARFQQQAALATTSALGHGVGPGGQAAIAYAASRLAAHGWGQDQLGPLINLWNQESGWNSYAVNPSSGAYGIPQSLGHGHPYDLGDYKAQVDWGENYIAQTYGSPAAAWGHEQAFNWYDQGGLAKPGFTGLMNGTGQPEAVLTQSQWSSLAALAAAGAQAVAGGVTVPIVVTIDGKKVYEATRTVGWQRQARNGKSVWAFRR